METEKRLIDANETITAFTNWLTSRYDGRMPRDIVAEISTVDAVEVVRCKDCKHWHEKTGWCYHHSHFVDTNGGFCHPWESTNWKMLNADDFCSYGERRTDE